MRWLRVGVLVAVVAMVVAPSGAAQIGVMGGWNYSMATAMVGSQDVDTGDRSGLQIGAVYTRGSFLTLVVQGLYSQKGFTADSGSSTAANVELNYIELPIMLGLKIPIIGGLIGGPRVYGGIAPAFKIKCEVDSTGTGSVPGFTCDDVQTFDFGFKAGLGFHILFIGVDVAYTWSTTDLWKVDAGSIKNRVLSVTGVLGLP